MFNDIKLAFCQHKLFFLNQINHLFYYLIKPNCHFIEAVQLLFNQDMFVSMNYGLFVTVFMVSLKFNYELSMEMDGTVLKQTAADDTTSFLQTHGQFHRI